jgi:hypothetical protein
MVEEVNHPDDYIETVRMASRVRITVGEKSVYMAAARLA